MNEKEPKRMETIVSMTILSESQRLSEKDAAGEEIIAEEVRPIPLDDFRESFANFGDDFMSDELLQSRLAWLKSRVGDIKETFPQGSTALLAAFPCDKNGTVYTPEEIKQGQYLTLLFIDPKTDLSVGFGGVGLNTYGNLLPKEIQEQCTFDVQYDSDGYWGSVEDYEKIAEQYTAAYKALQKLLQQEN